MNDILKKTIISFVKRFFYFHSIVFLFPFFFVSHGNNEHYGILSFYELALLLFRYFLLAIFFWFISVLLFKQRDKSVIFCLYLLCIYFLFGYFHDSLKLVFENTFLISYTFLLPCLAVSVLLIVIWLKRTKVQLYKYTLLSKRIITVLSLLEVVVFGYNITTHKERLNDLGDEPYFYSDSKKCGEKPDIFFVVFDGLTSLDILKDEFLVDTKGIDSIFKAENWYIADSSKSNYNFTTLSVNSTLNFSYLKFGVEDKVYSTLDFVETVKSLEYTKIPAILKKQGYTLINAGVFNLNQMPYGGTVFFDRWLQELISNQTLYSRISRDIGWNFLIRNPFTGKPRIPKSYYERKRNHLKRNLDNFQELIHEMKSSSTIPRFVYSHLILPHEPFYLDSLGQNLSDSMVIFNRIPMKEGYRNQAMYARSLLKEIIHIANIKSNRPKVIIIEGDHGFRDYPPDAPKEYAFKNLNAFYFSDSNYSSLYKSISPVNTFKVVLNKYFCQNIPYDKDSSIYLRKEKLR